MNIIESEGTIIALERIKNYHFLKIKKQNDNQYAYFPIDRTQLEKYFSGEITTSSGRVSRLQWYILRHWRQRFVVEFVRERPRLRLVPRPELRQRQCWQVLQL